MQARLMKRMLSMLLAFALLVPQGLSFAHRAEAAASNVVLQQSFEDGQPGGWEKLSWGGAGDVSVTSDTASEGGKSLKFANRASRNSSLSLNLTGLLQSGRTYDISFKAKAGTGSDTLHLASKVVSAGKDSYPWIIGNKSANADAWTTFETETGYKVPDGTSEFRAWVESDSTSTSTADIYVDEVLIKDVTPPTDTPSNNVLQQSFEDGQPGGWEKLSWGAAGDVTVTSDTASEGGKSLKFANRATRNSSLSLNLTGLLQSGRTYDISFKAKVGSGSDTLHLASKVVSGGKDSYPWIIGNTSANADAWTVFKTETSYKVPDGTSEFRVWIESDSASTSTADFYVDEVLIKDVTPGGSGGGEEEPGDLDQSGIRSDFESGLQGWGPRNGTDPVSVSTADNHTAGGSNSLLTTAAGQYDGPLINALGKMHGNHQYDLSVWVKMAPGQAATSLRLSVQHGSSTYANVSANATVTDGAWVKLSGKFTLTNTPTVLNAYVETAANNGGPRSFYIDDFALTYVGPVDGPQPIQTDIPSMKDVYADSFSIGAAVTPEQLTGTHADLLKKHYNSLVAENAMKWDAIEPTEGNFNFAGGDAIREFAVENGMEMRGHTLLWHQQTPDWVFKRGTADLTTSPADQELLLERLENHIKAVVEHFGTDIQTYDVVNEVIDPAQQDGFRRSKWFQLLGTSYIDKAFEYARKYAPAGTKLVINDYSTTDATKRRFLYDLVADLKERGIPVDGVGHQMHVDIQRPTADDIVQTLDMFTALGVENQVTELDVSVYTGAGNYNTLPEDVGIELGHRYAELFDAFKQAKDNLTGVTLWGIGDDHTWLAGQNGHANDYPLPFDARLQAKQAFWGIVDPSELDVLTKRQSVTNGTPAAVDGEAELIWSTVSTLSIPATTGTLSATVKPLWDENHLYVYVDVTDPASNANDAIDIYVDRNNGKTETYENDDVRYTLTRGHSEAAEGVSYSVKERTGGYVIEASLPLDAAAMDQEIGFDLTVTDGTGGHSIAWNDVTFSQATNTSKYGVFEFIASSKTTDAVYGTPVIDGSPDSAWTNANEVSTDVWVAGTSGSTAKVKTLWDAGHLYVYAVVTDSLLSKVSANDHEKDSMEIFVDANNGKTTSYQSDDGQYRVNYANEQSYRGAANASNFTTATREVDGGYVVEAAIALDAKLMTAGSLLGFDVQVNNDENGDGTRDSVAIWNDPTGNSWQNTSRFGVIRLTGGESSNGGGGGYVVIPSDSSKVENNTVKPPVRLEAGRAEAVLTGQALDQALKQAASDANGKKIAIVDITAQTGANAYSVQLPAGSLTASSDSYSIALKTEFGVIELPSGMLAGMDTGSASTVSVRVSMASTDGLSPEVREQIGDRPFLNLEVLAGDQTLAWHNPDAPVTVSIPYTPTAEERSNPDHILIWYIDGNGTVTPVPNARYDAELGVVRFETVHFSDYAVAYAEKTFGDLQSVPWAKQAIELMASRGIIKGTSDSVFAPAASIKRADFLALLVRALELTGTGKDAGAMFRDVEPSAYYYEEVKIAKELGIASGLGDNRFLPGGEISRQDMMVLTVQALKAAGKEVKPGNGGTLDGFSDAAAVAGYAKESAEALIAAGIVNGSGGKLLPEAPLTRAQAAVILKAIWEQ